VLAASAALVSAPVHAQDAAPEPGSEEEPAAAPAPVPEPTLEDLIPNEAVANPEGWAAQGVPAEAVAAEDAAPEVVPDSAIAEVPGIDVPWPEQQEVPQLAPLEPEEDIEFAEFDLGGAPPVAMGDEEHISDELTLVFPADPALFPEREAFVDRFNALSTIESLDDAGNAARLGAQARADQTLLERLLRIYGYYDATVYRSIAGAGADEEGKERGPNVRFEIVPGVQYHFDKIDLGDLATAGADYAMLRSQFQIETGDPLLADRIVAERYDLDTALGESGYPFAAIMEPDLLVDHARTAGDLTMPVTPGGKYRFGAVISNLPNFMSSKHLADIARFEPGDIYQRSLELDLRRAILATGLVGTVTMLPVESKPPADGEPGTVNIAVAMTPAKLRTIAGSIGYGTGEGFKIQGRWEHRNLFPPEGMLRVRAILGTQEQLIGVTFRKNNFGGRDRILTIDAFASTIDYDAYDARTTSLVGTFERVSTVLFQKPFSYSAGIELTATGERERDANGDLGPRQTYFIAALPLFAQVDTSNDLLDPVRGYRLGARISPEVSRTNSVESFYVRSQVDASYYRSMSDKVVLAGRVRFGSITGAPVEAIAPSRRLYAGGGGSVRGYDYKGIGPHSSEGDPTGGRSLAEFSLEARIKTGMLGGALGIVPFVDAGTVGTGSLPDFDEIKIGVGVGARYYTSFGPLRIDLGVPLNPGPDDPTVGVYVGLGHSF
jgi:translocation and assembly module TamA